MFAVISGKSSPEGRHATFPGPIQSPTTTLPPLHSSLMGSPLCGGRDASALCGGRDGGGGEGEERDATTQDSILQDSGFLPGTPPAKKVSFTE